MNKAVVLSVLAILLLATTGATAASDRHVVANLVPVGGSGITGVVSLEQLPAGGTAINVTAMGLTPGTRYVSLYYDNHTCELEPYSPDDVVGRYTGNPGGVGAAHNKVDDDLDEINSVSVRLDSDLTLLACAVVH